MCRLCYLKEENKEAQRKSSIISTIHEDKLGLSFQQLGKFHVSYQFRQNSLFTMCIVNQTQAHIKDGNTFKLVYSWLKVSVNTGPDDSHPNETTATCPRHTARHLRSQKGYTHPHCLVSAFWVWMWPLPLQDIFESICHFLLWDNCSLQLLSCSQLWLVTAISLRLNDFGPRASTCK